MYVAYTFSSGALLIVMLVTLFGLKWEMNHVLMAIGITALIGFTYNARLSRSAWLNMMVSYNAEWKKENEEREMLRAELRAKGINPDEASSLTSHGHHGYESSTNLL
jgi:hypothetical protein